MHQIDKPSYTLHADNIADSIIKLSRFVGIAPPPLARPRQVLYSADAADPHQMCFFFGQLLVHGVLPALRRLLQWLLDGILRMSRRATHCERAIQNDVTIKCS